MTRKFFQIGFNKCGTTFIERLFRLNGIPVRHWEKGALAEDIAYSRLVGRAPLARWAGDTVAFTDMESVRYVNAPIIEGFRDFAYLDRSFPGAVFLLNTRRIGDWINSRYRHMGGRYARAHAANRGVALADLADLWRADWDAHLAACRAHFGNRPEFIEIDIDHAAPEDYRKALSPWFDLPRLPDPPGAGQVRSRQAYAAEVAAMLSAPQPGQAVAEGPRDRFAAALAGFASPAHLRAGTAELPGLTRLDVASGELRGADGALLPIRRTEAGRYLADPLRPGHLLIAAAANDMAGVSDRGVYHFDMRDACRTGSTSRLTPPGPVIAPSRREGAANVFLWPMPRFHRLGNDAFLGPDPAAFTPPEQRADRAIWLGGNRSDPQQDRHIALLRGLQDVAGIDLPLAPDPQAPDPLHSHRFVLCLAGASLSGGLLPALNAGAVVLKAEDGWQLYHSGLLRPWEHYIPLAPEADDLAEKLIWARDNPAALARMVAAARRVCAALADPALRRRHLAQVLAAYRAASGQD